MRPYPAAKLASLIMVTALVPAGVALAGTEPAAEATLAALKNSGVSGTLVFTQLAGGGVKVEGTIHGLEPNSQHGFHVHDVGDCSAPDGASAGPHFNPTKKDHGDPTSDHSHVGDLGNVQADAKGSAKISITKKEATVAPGANSFASRSIILHKLKDDLKSQPAGASGDKIACGVIKLKATP